MLPLLLAALLVQDPVDPGANLACDDFEETVAHVRGLAGVVHTPPSADLPFDAYEHPSGNSFFVSVPGMSGHPAVVHMRLIQGPDGDKVDLGGCAFGDQAEARALFARFSQMLELADRNGDSANQQPEAVTPPTPPPSEQTAPSSSPSLRGSISQ